jgi:hypothetical protein
MIDDRKMIEMIEISRKISIDQLRTPKKQMTGRLYQTKFYLRSSPVKS